LTLKNKVKNLTFKVKELTFKAKTEAHVGEQPDHSCHMKVKWLGVDTSVAVKDTPPKVKVNDLTLKTKVKELTTKAKDTETS